MKRRTFIKDTSLLCLSSYAMAYINTDNNIIFGNGPKKYTWDKSWAADNANKLPVKDCHEMVFTKKGDIIMLTNETKNNVIVFDKKGKIKSSWGYEFPGAHGLSIHGDEEQTLFITDTDRHQFFNTTLDGKIIMTWDFPLDTGKYTTKNSFVPTETAITREGEIYVADGYGDQYITHYDAAGKVKNIFGGRGTEDKHFDNAHGICIDYRSEIPTLIITDRNRCCFKRFTMSGLYIETIALPGANVCRPVIKGDYLYAAVLTSGNTSNANTGFVIILDKTNKIVSTLCATAPIYENGHCKKMYQTVQLFKHPHDVMIDDEDNLYVCQWNSGQVYPYKFIPIVH